MTSAPPAKRLTYIVNYMSADDAQHFVHIPNLLNHLESLGWEIDLVSERGGEGRAEVLGQKVTFLSRQSKWRRAVRLPAHLLAMRRRGGRLVFVRISKFAALVSALMGRLFGWKTVYWLSGTVEDFNLRGGLRARIGLAGMWLLFRLIDRLATGPETMVTYYARRYGLPEWKIVLLYNDIALDKFAPAGATEKADQVHVLLVHRLSPVRETDRYFPALLEALDLHARSSAAPVILDICGDGPERNELEAIARSAPAGVDVRFHGAVPQLDLAEYYARATIFVMPSYREGFPRVMIEAMAHGLPIVATDAGGTRDLCGPMQQRYVIDRDDVAAFGRAVARLLASADDRHALSEENLRSVERFATPAVARMYDRALSALIAAPAAS
jgi:glycosyltransferase involved in cell wall biosynthesis